jgi:hypothetical protein
MLPCYGASGRARTAATPPTDRWSVARARVRRRGRLDASGRCASGRACLGTQHGADVEGSGGVGTAAGARPAAAARWRSGRARRRAWRALALAVLLVPSLTRFFSKFFNRTVPSDEYQSCRSRYQLQLLQRLYRVLLPRFESVQVPTLNVSRVLSTVFSGL